MPWCCYATRSRPGTRLPRLIAVHLTTIVPKTVYSSPRSRELMMVLPMANVGHSRYSWLTEEITHVCGG